MIEIDNESPDKTMILERDEKRLSKTKSPTKGSIGTDKFGSFSNEADINYSVTLQQREDRNIIEESRKLLKAT